MRVVVKCFSDNKVTNCHGGLYLNHKMDLMLSIFNSDLYVQCMCLVNINFIMQIFVCLRRAAEFLIGITQKC